MSDCQEEFINVLVLGSSNIKISYFIKLFSAYLMYGSYKEGILCEPNLKTVVKNVTETTSTIITIGKQNFHFIDTPGLQKSTKSYKEILDILLHFRAGFRLQAIILLVEPDVKGDENNFEQYSTHFLSGLKEYTKNILYVVLYKDTCMWPLTYKRLKKTMNVINMSAVVPEKCNMFHLHVDTFYEPSEDNWEQSVNFCRDVFRYITENGLKSFYVRCGMPSEESLINLVYDLISILLYLLCLTERNKNHLIIIKDYQKNITACYTDKCYVFKYVNKHIDIISPKICHETCNCTQSILDAEKCSIFKTDDKKCSVCNCDDRLHRGYFVKVHGITSNLNMDYEKSALKSTLIQLYLFIKKHLSIPISKFTNGYSNREDFNNNLVTEIQNHSNTEVSLEKLLVCIHKLFEIKELVKIFPKVINENFPDGLRLYIASQNQSKFKPKSLEAEYYKVKRELDQLKLQMKKSTPTNNLSSSQENAKGQNLEKKLNIPKCASDSNDEDENN